MSIKIKQFELLVRRMLCFQEAGNCGSISKAAEKNCMKQSNFSVNIRDLEDNFGEKLLTRVYNGIKLTEAGREVYMLSFELTNVLNKINNAKIKSSGGAGAIRLWTSDGLGTGYLSKSFPEFYLNYPNVNIEVICSLEMPRLDQFDMAVVYEKPESSQLVTVGEYNLTFGLFASKEYLARYGCPRSMDDILQNHRICTRANYASVWKKWEAVLEKASYVATITNSSSMLLQLVKDGIGIGLLPIGTTTHETDLIRLSKIKTSFEHKFWIVVRKDVKDVDKIKALLNFIEHASAKL